MNKPKHRLLRVDNTTRKLTLSDFKHYIVTETLTCEKMNDENIKSLNFSYNITTKSTFYTVKLNHNIVFMDHTIEPVINYYNNIK